jgi:hypothetical protein
MFHWAFAQIHFVKELHDGAVSATQSRFIGLLAVGCAVLPAAPDDALPLESQRSDGGVMGRAFGALLQDLGSHLIFVQDLGSHLIFVLLNG